MSARGAPIFNVEPAGLEGFNNFYRAEIEPLLAKRNSRRRFVLGADAKRARTFMLWVSAAAVIVVVASGWDFRALTLIPLFGIPVYFLSQLGGLDEVRKTKLSVKSAIMDWIGLKVASRRRDHVSDSRALEQQITDAQRYEVRWAGGVFDFSVGSLDKPYDAVGAKASGQVLVFEIHIKKQFAKPVAFRRVSGGFEILADILNGSVNRVELEDPRFMEQFEVWCDDEIAARFALTPAVMERIRTFREDGVIFAGCFSGHSLQIAVRPYDLFLLDEFWYSDDPQEYAKAFAEMCARPRRIYKALDRLT